MKKNTKKEIAALLAAYQEARKIEEARRADRFNNDLYQQEQIARAAIPFYKDNLKIAIFNDYVSDVCVIWNKYAGKRYGEKTQTAIYEEIKQALGVGFYTYSRYDYSEMSIHVLNPETGCNYYCDADIKAYTHNKRMVSHENVIQTVGPEDFKQWDSIKKTANPKKAAVRMLKELKKLEAAEKVFHAAIDKFNQDYKPSGLDSVYSGNMKRFYF